MKNYVLVLGCFSMLWFGAKAQIRNNGQVSMLDSGKTFQFVDMTDINGIKIKASSLVGKTVVMNFWFLGCPPCRYEIPQLSKIADRYKYNKDVVFIAVATDGTDSLKNFLKSNTFSYRLVSDGKWLNAKYGISMSPLSLIISKKGMIIFNSYTERFVSAVPSRITDILKNQL
ncbi:TlpA family protein disulfide reductase [bacterium]|nr:MAG: TlpA family protein disulfide reductase [bacterium]